MLERGVTGCQVTSKDAQENNSLQSTLENLSYPALQLNIQQWFTTFWCQNCIKLKISKKVIGQSLGFKFRQITTTSQKILFKDQSFTDPGCQNWFHSKFYLIHHQIIKLRLKHKSYLSLAELAYIYNWLNSEINEEWKLRLSWEGCIEAAEENELLRYFGPEIERDVSRDQEVFQTDGSQIPSR